VVSSAARADDKDKLPEIGEIMDKAHAKGTGYRFTVKDAVQKKEWDEAAKTVKEWRKLGEALAKNKPEKGTPASWKKQTGTYNTTLKTLAGAIEKKNASSANGALGKIGMLCGGCHKAHRP
jgi:hypothetical protein